MIQRGEMYLLKVVLLLVIVCTVEIFSSEESCADSEAEMGLHDTEIIVSDNTEKLSKAVGEHVLEVVQQSAKKDKFLVALSGGSLPKLLAAGLLEHADQIDFSKWHVFFADERYVGLDHADSNYLSCQNEFLSKVPVKSDQVYGIDISVPVEESAVRYQQILEKVSGTSLKDGGAPPVFDLILLGMGPDGHTCSLFPGHPLLKEFSRWVAPISDSPKPPPERITLTYPVLNAAENVFFLAAGKGKQDVLPVTGGMTLGKMLELGDETLPAARVRPKGRLVWFVDVLAAQKL